MPPVIGIVAAAITAAVPVLGTTIVGSLTVGGLLTSVVTTAALFGAEMLLNRPKQQQPNFKLPPGPVAQEMDLQSVTARFYSYGRNRTGGAIFFQEVNGHWLGYGIVINCRPIDAVEQHFIDDEAVPLSTGATVEPSGNPLGYSPASIDHGAGVYWPNAGMKWAAYQSYVYIPNQGPTPVTMGTGPIMFLEFRNAQNAGRFSRLLTHYFASIWTTTEHLARGLACVYLQANALDIQSRMEHYPRGFPVSSTVLRGAHVFDPRDVTQSFYLAGAELTAAQSAALSNADFYKGGDYRDDGVGRIWSVYNSTWKYSTNPALQIADFLTFSEAFGLTYDDIDWDSIAAAANDCERLVPVYGGGTGAFAQAHLTWSAEEEWRDVLGRLLVACDGQIWEDETGKIKLWIGKWEEPTITLTESDLAMPIAFDPTTGVYDGDNYVTPSYVEPRAAFSRNTSLYVTDDASIALVGERRATIDMPAVQDFNQAYRLAYRAMRRKNAPMRIDCVAGPRALLADGQRVVRLELPTFGVSGVFRVMGMTAESLARIRLSLFEVTEDMFDDVVPPFDPINASLPGVTPAQTYRPPAPVAPSLGASYGGGFVIISASVAAPSNGDTVAYARFEMREVDPISHVPLSGSAGVYAALSSYTGQYSAVTGAIAVATGVFRCFELHAWFISNGSPSDFGPTAFITVTAP